MSIKEAHQRDMIVKRKGWSFWAFGCTVLSASTGPPVACCYAAIRY